MTERCRRGQPHVELVSGQSLHEGCLDQRLPRPSERNGRCLSQRVHLVRQDSLELFKGEKGENIPGFTPLVWSPDGSQVLFTKGGAPGQGPTFGLWRVPAQGGKAQEVGLTMEGLRGVRLHPDGKRIAFAAGQQYAPEVWVMENVLPPARSSK